MKNLAIIPARSGSKGLKDKNIKLLNGKPLLAYSIEVGQKSGVFDEIIVSTDSEKYAKIAKKYGANVPFLRDENLSNDTASTLDVVRDILQRYKKNGVVFDTVTILQPTSPLRVEEDILNGFEMLKEKNANFVVSVCEMDHSPLWANTLPEDKSMENFLNLNVINKPRQSIPTYYRINGALYILKTRYLMETTNIYEKDSFAIVMPKDRSVDIDDKLDFALAETILNA